MVFSSLLFLFLFFPLVLTGYFIFRKKTGNFFLLLASLFFYSWGEMQTVLILLVSIFINYCLALLIETFRKRQTDQPGKAGFFLWLAILFNLGLLVFYKYLLFLTYHFNLFFQVLDLSYRLNLPGTHLPLGLSFFTFRALSYVIDVYSRRVTASSNLINTALYFSFFPLAIAGPIVRYSEMAVSLIKRKMTLEKFLSGVMRFILGLGKKCLIANTVGSVSDWVFTLSPDRLPGEVAWLGILCYTIHIYFDFSGYSDMAIGLGRMFGFEFQENFDYPYISRTIREFWRRWHISLSSWFRDYLYIPLGGNRVSSPRVYGNLVLVFLLCGLWHGAQWTFVIWGLWHGFFILLERLGLGRWIDSFWKPLGHLYALLVITLGWVFFRAETLSDAGAFFQTLFGFSNGNRLEYPIELFLNREVTLALLAGAIFSMPVPLLVRTGRSWVFSKFSGFSGSIFDHGLSLGFALVLGVVLVTSVLTLAGGTYNPFIYFRF